MNVDPFMSSKRTEGFMPCRIFLMMGGEWGGGRYQRESK